MLHFFEGRRSVHYNIAIESNLLNISKATSIGFFYFAFLNICYIVVYLCNGIRFFCGKIISLRAFQLYDCNGTNVTSNNGYWSDLRDYSETDETRQLLKVQCRLYERTIKTAKSLMNSLISILDQTFPGANNFFPTSYRNAKGHYKWVDFVRRFWHKDNVAAVSIQSFSESFRKWYKRTGYHYSQADAERIHRHARESVATFKKNDSTKPSEAGLCLRGEAREQA